MNRKYDDPFYEPFVKGILNEAPLFNAKKLKVYSDEEKAKLSYKLSMRSLKLVNKLSRANKNIRSIDKSKGNFKRYEASNAIITSLKSVRRMISSRMRNNDLLETVSTLERSVNILMKHEKDFSRAYSQGNELLISLYRSMVAAISMAVLKLNVHYVDFNRDNLQITLKETNLEFMNKSEMKALSTFISYETDGTLHKIFKAENKIGLINEDNGGFWKPELMSDDGELLPAFKIGIVIALIWAVVVVIRYILINYYQWRVDIAVSLRESADILYKELPLVQDEEIKRKQAEKADQLYRLANKIDIEETNAEGRSDSSLEKLDNQTVREFDSNKDDTDGFDLRFDI